MVDSLSVKNFKGLDNLEISLAPFTLIGGSNNVGKTSVLEALFLLYGHRSPFVFQQLCAFRNALFPNLDIRDMWENLFYDYDMNRVISIAATRDRNSESLEICRDDHWDIAAGITNLPKDMMVGTNTDGYSYPLKVHYSYGKKENQFHLALTETPAGINIFSQSDTTNQQSLNNLPIVNFSNDRMQNVPQLFDLVGKVNRNKQRTEIIDVIREIDPRIMSVELGEKQRIYLEIDGLSEMIPITSMGTGISNVLYWTALALSNTTKIMLIDEIETGIYYQHMESVISKLCAIGLRYDCQIIATTHSLDCIKAFARCGEKYSNRTSYVRLERSNKSEEIIAKDIQADQLNRMLNSDWEVR